MKKKLLISFSGGKTSGYMLWWLMNEWEDRTNWEIIVVFANTGKEAEGTLFFVDECAQEWGIDIVWVEGRHKDDEGNLYSDKGWAVKHKVVSFETASRHGEPFEEMISVLGIPSTNSPFCSEQLKKLTIESYIKSIEWKGYYTAIGIRVDEGKRLPIDKITGLPSEQEGLNRKLIYPFAFIIPKFKHDVTEWWDSQPFNLNIHSDEGNCNNCWKKDLNRLVRNAIRNPSSFDWWQLMTDKYGHHNPRDVNLLPPFNFYRGNMSPNDIKQLASQGQQIDLFILDEPYNSCEESCEAF